MFRVALVTAVLKPVVQPTLGRLVNGTASQRASGLVTSARKKCTTALRYYKLQNFKKTLTTLGLWSSSSTVQPVAQDESTMGRLLPSRVRTLMSVYEKSSAASANCQIFVIELKMPFSFHSDQQNPHEQ